MFIYGKVSVRSSSGYLGIKMTGLGFLLEVFKRNAKKNHWRHVSGLTLNIL